MMKIIYPHIKTRPGGIDVYIERLEKVLKKRKVFFKELKFSRVYEIFPFLLLLKKLPSKEIIMSNAEFGWVFKRKKNKLIIVVHNFIFDKEYQKSTSLLQKIYHYGILQPNLLLSTIIADKVVCISNYYKSQFIKRFPWTNKKCVRIYNWVDTSKFKIKRYNDHKETNLLFVGNLTKRKGADLLPKIMSKLGNKYKLYLTGGLDKITPIYKNSNIIFIGNKKEEELAKIYQKCDILLFPSRLEGFGLPIAEAMSCGLPVVCTDYSAMPELVENEKGGFLCKMGDVNDFASKIKLLNNKKMREKMGRYNALKARKMFSEKTALKNYFRLFESLKNE